MWFLIERMLVHLSKAAKKRRLLELSCETQKLLEIIIKNNCQGSAADSCDTGIVLFDACFYLKLHDTWVASLALKYPVGIYDRKLRP